jgi:hypothetical protein
MMTVAWIASGYLAYSTLKYAKELRVTYLALQIAQYLAYAYLSAVIVYFFFSLSFLYLKEWGAGNLLAAIGVLIAFT